MRSYIRRRGDVAAAEMARDRAQSRQHQLDIKVKPTGQHFMAAIALTDSAMAIAASYLIYAPDEASWHLARAALLGHGAPAAAST
jgi:arginyl-tRNA--protein-N-Asp/Glu arginylyltransferase